MPSGVSTKPPRVPLPDFFLDRGLGKHYVADAIRSQGGAVLCMGDVFPNDGQSIPDPEWIRRADAEGWVALTKDRRVLRDHRLDIQRSTLRIFIIPNSHLTGTQMADRVIANWNRILKRCQQPGPFAYSILPNRLEMLYP